jgi:hypothetical protein
MINIETGKPEVDRESILMYPFPCWNATLMFYRENYLRGNGDSQSSSNNSRMWWAQSNRNGGINDTYGEAEVDENWQNNHYREYIYLLIHGEVSARAFDPGGFERGNNGVMYANIAISLFH